MKFTKAELKFILNVLNQVSVSGRESLKMLLGLIERIEIEISEETGAPEGEGKEKKKE